MAYTVACYHDLGLAVDREHHELEYRKEYERMLRTGLVEKIINYYEDY